MGSVSSDVVTWRQNGTRCGAAKSAVFSAIIAISIAEKMDKDNFEPRIGRMRALGSGRGRAYLNAVVHAAKRAGAGAASSSRKFTGARLGRGSAVGRLLASRGRYAKIRARRAIIKARIVRLGGKGVAAARAHLRYIQRDASVGDGKDGGLYSANSDRADGVAFLERGQDDRHQFRFIVSPEDGAEYDDLRPLIRRLMARMEEDLGTRLDWVAADHRDTGYPHTHIIVRGKDDRGENLVIAPEYISRGMRERVAELVSLDLGPRSDREIEDRLRRDVDAERLTGTDRRLARMAGEELTLTISGRDRFDEAILTGRLRKLERFGLAEPQGEARWRLADDLQNALRVMGERGDIVRTMQRAFSAEHRRRDTAALRIFDPAKHGPILGRLVERGLADEGRDRHYLIVDACDGNAWYVAAGNADAVEPLPDRAIVMVEPRASGVRAVDRTIAEIATANDGRYSAKLHAAHDPSASPEFIATHVRRLEAMRRGVGLVREDDGIWNIASDHLARVERFEARMTRDRPIIVVLLSPLPLERLSGRHGATWLDGELEARDPVPLRDAGFGREVRDALQARRSWLLAEELAAERNGSLEFLPGALDRLRRGEWARTTAMLGQSLGKQFVEAEPGTQLSGVVRRPVDLASGRFAVIEGEREFSLVPWRPVLARAIGREVHGISRSGGISWTLGRARSLER